MSRHGAQIRIPESALAEWIGFKDGVIHQILIDHLPLDTIVVLIEHPDLPEVPQGEMAPWIDPVFQWGEPKTRIWPPHLSRVQRLLRSMRVKR
jgi:hypothetical protein